MSDTPAQPDPPPAGGGKKPTDETVKETFESIVIAFVLAFVFRAYVVEAFVIPTGSMAPTLLGAHAPITCDECGYAFKVGMDHSGKPPALGEADCPMCHNAMTFSVKPTPSSGDRILVQKYLYSLVEPRRWDVVVFKSPEDPQINFIKRLVGLPEEEIYIVEGNIFVRPLGADDDAWHIARKTDREANPHAFEIQNAVWQPLYHSQYVPLDAASRRWHAPWRVAAGAWEGVGDDSPPARRYTHTASEAGRLEFDLGRVIRPSPGLHVYNHQGPNADRGTLPFEDVRIAAGFQPSAADLALTLQTTGRIDATGEPRTLIGRIDAQGVASIGYLDDDGAFVALDEQEVGAFTPNRTRDVELWFVDQELSLWVDGERILANAFEIEFEQIREWPGLSKRPRIAIEVSGCPVTLHRVKVDRDLIYTNDGIRGALTHFGSSGPARVLADQFFCLGDNSPASSDSRAWESINPWVRADKFTSKPQAGMVPRRLMMGRAFFVYYPGPFGFTPGGIKLIPNFGDMRFIH